MRRPADLTVGLWLRAELGRRPGNLAAMVLGVAVPVAMLASIGAFVTGARATMTHRAVAGVVVDWQVEAQAGAHPDQVLEEVARQPHVTTAVPVSFGRTDAFEAVTGGSTQRTGPGVIVGLPDRYRDTFPGAVRDLAGRPTGVLVAQQTAANLHVGPGDTVAIEVAALPARRVVVAGIVDLPQADSLFQAVGAPTGAQPQAPPDNVLLVPQRTWQELFGAVTATRPDLVRFQVHARVDHRLPSDPAAAFTTISGRARNLEVAMSGAGLVGDNLAAALDAARSDALYAQVLFLFLGGPGALLAAVVTVTIAGTGTERRRRRQSLLRARGASSGQISRLAAAEAGVVGVVGAAAGLGLAAVLGRAMFGTTSSGASGRVTGAWLALGGVAGLGLAAAAHVVPARRASRLTSVASARRSLPVRRRPAWFRFGLDGWLLALSGAVYWLTSRNGYELVLAPEGVPTVSVSYWAFAAPALLWVGSGLLLWRICDLLLDGWIGVVRRGVGPVAGRLAPTVAATIRRQRGVVARAVVLVALALGFASSTAVFNSTYRQQAEIDAVLTNGADVTVTEPPGVVVPPSFAREIDALPGVAGVEPIQHRFAYVGADLQDLYGVRPATVVDATRLQDAYFAGGTARQLIRDLADRPDGILVSLETVHDFQLRPGDPLTLRLQDGRTKQLTDVRFHYLGVAKEFPTAPSDSFLVADADYIARQTGSNAVGSFLVDTDGDPARVARRLRTLVGPGPQVTDITTSRRIVGSSLTAVDLTGLTRVELGFALLLIVTTAGVVLGVGFAERRRAFAVLAALGASRRQLARMVWAEVLLVSVLGLAFGAATGAALSKMLVTELRGVFDPPPAHLAVPWGYLVAVAAVALAGVATAALVTIRASGRTAVADLRSS